MKRRHGLLGLSLLSAAAPAAAQVVPTNGGSDVPGWLLLLGSIVTPGITYGAGFLARASVAAAAAATGALSRGEGWRGALAAVSATLERMVSAPADAPALPPARALPEVKQ